MSGTRRPSGGRRWYETEGVSVQVARVVYLPDKSDPEDGLWTWAYEIHIENRRNGAITLLQRNWLIEYGGVEPQKTKSDYIDGQQPRLAPGSRFTYVSGVPLPNASGKMVGWYLVETADGERFKVAIPAFELRAGKAISEQSKPHRRSKPAATDSKRLNAAVRRFADESAAGSKAVLDTRKIGLSPRAQWDLERFFLKSQFFPFNEYKSDIFYFRELVDEYALYLTLDPIAVGYDDRYIDGPISAMGIIVLNDALRRAAEALVRTAVILDSQRREAATTRVAAIFDAIRRGGDIEKLLPLPPAATASAAEPPRELKAHAGGSYELSPTEMEAVVKGDSTLFGLLRRYATLLESTPLPAGGFESKAEARTAGRLVATYRNLRKRQIELGLEALPQDKRVAEAQRLRVAFYWRQRKEHPARGEARHARRLKAATPP